MISLLTYRYCITVDYNEQQTFIVNIGIVAVSKDTTDIFTQITTERRREINHRIYTHTLWLIHFLCLTRYLYAQHKNTTNVHRC